MTKIELQDKIKTLRSQLDKALKELEKMNTVFNIDNKDKLFKDWNLVEQQQLIEIKPKAWEWLSNNRDKSILDYNSAQIKDEDKVLLYK